MTCSVSLLYPPVLKHLLSTSCMPSILPAVRGHQETWALGGFSLVMWPPLRASLVSYLHSLAHSCHALLPLLPWAQHGSCVQLQAVPPVQLAGPHRAGQPQYGQAAPGGCGGEDHPLPSLQRPESRLQCGPPAAPDTAQFLRSGAGPGQAGVGCGERGADTGRGREGSSLLRFSPVL